MKISVIIPTYKPQDYLWACLDSLMKQTLSKEDFEVILVLNGCTEPYKSAIERYIAANMQGMNVVFIHTEMGGVSNARNIGIDAARGEYVSFVDDDDIVSPTFLEELLRISSPDCVGCANSYAFENDITKFSSNFIGSAFEKCKQRSFTTFNYRSLLSPPWGKLIHRDIIGDNRFPLDLKKSEDSVFCMRISPNISDMKLASADAIYYQRLRKGSAMRTKQPKWDILKEHLYIEWKYISEWCKHPFKYNAAFVLSRIVACGKNCMRYLQN